MKQCSNGLGQGMGANSRRATTRTNILARHIGSPSDVRSGTLAACASCCSSEATLSTRVVLLTGASRGFGRAVAEALAAQATRTGQQLHLILVARNAMGLSETERAVTTIVDSVLESGPSNQCVICTKFAVDLKSPEALNDEIDNIICYTKAALGTRGELLLVHNAGTLGQLSYVQDLHASECMAAMNLNVTSVSILTARVLREFAPLCSLASSSTRIRIRIINVSSLLALQPFPAWSLYAAGKAARDMLMRVIATEAEARKEDIRTLSYAPGPMQTAMVEEVMETCDDPGVRQKFHDMHREGLLLNPRDSADKLVQLLERDAYENGAHIDFYDV